MNTTIRYAPGAPLIERTITSPPPDPRFIVINNDLLRAIARTNHEEEAGTDVLR